MAQNTANTSGQENSAGIHTRRGTRLIVKTAADLAQLVRRSSVVAHEVSEALNQIIDQHEAMARKHGLKL